MMLLYMIVQTMLYDFRNPLNEFCVPILETPAKGMVIRRSMSPVVDL